MAGDPRATWNAFCCCGKARATPKRRQPRPGSPATISPATRASWCGEDSMIMSRVFVLIVVLALTGCDRTDPYLREGVWHPNGANAANLRAMVTRPTDLVMAAPASRADGGMAAASVDRLRRGQVRSLPDSGVARLVPVGGGPSAPPQAAQPAAPPQGSAN